MRRSHFPNFDVVRGALLKVVQQERDRVQLQNEEINQDLTTIRREIINSNSPVKHQKPVSHPNSIRVSTQKTKNTSFVPGMSITIPKSTKNPSTPLVDKIDFWHFRGNFTMHVNFFRETLTYAFGD